MDKIIKTSKNICRVLNVLFWVVLALSAAALLAIAAMDNLIAVRERLVQRLPEFITVVCNHQC